MEPTAGQVLEAVLRVQDQITDIRGEAMHSEAVKAAVRDGIKEAVSDPDLWAAAMSAMQIHAQRQAGSWLFGGIRAALSRALLFIALGIAVYMTGGWSALVAWFKTAP